MTDSGGRALALVVPNGRSDGPDNARHRSRFTSNVHRMELEVWYPEGLGREGDQKQEMETH